jgi:hypothetical protein
MLNTNHIHSIIGPYTIMLPVKMSTGYFRVAIVSVNARGHESITSVYHARPIVAIETAIAWVNAH